MAKDTQRSVPRSVQGCRRLPLPGSQGRARAQTPRPCEGIAACPHQVLCCGRDGHRGCELPAHHGTRGCGASDASGCTEHAAGQVLAAPPGPGCPCQAWGHRRAWWTGSSPQARLSMPSRVQHHRAVTASAGHQGGDQTSVRLAGTRMAPSLPCFPLGRSGHACPAHRLGTRGALEDRLSLRETGSRTVGLAPQG